MEIQWLWHNAAYWWISVKYTIKQTATSLTEEKDYCECFMSSSITPTDLPAAWLIALKQVNCVINKHLAEQLHQSLPQCLQVPNLHAATSAVTSQHPCSCRVTVTTAFRWLCKRSSHGRHWFHFIHLINTLCTQWTRKKRGSLFLSISLANLNRFL